MVPVPQHNTEVNKFFNATHLRKLQQKQKNFFLAINCHVHIMRSGGALRLGLRLI